MAPMHHEPSTQGQCLCWRCGVASLHQYILYKVMAGKSPCVAGKSPASSRYLLVQYHTVQYYPSKYTTKIYRQIPQTGCNERFTLVELKETRTILSTRFNGNGAQTKVRMIYVDKQFYYYLVKYDSYYFISAWVPTIQYALFSTCARAHKIEIEYIISLWLELAELIKNVAMHQLYTDPRHTT